MCTLIYVYCILWHYAHIHAHHIYTRASSGGESCNPQAMGAGGARVPVVPDAAWELSGVCLLRFDVKRCCILKA